MGVSLLSCLLAFMPGEVPAPTVAVFALTAQAGVDDRLTQVVTGMVVAELRKTNAFSRVTAASELEALMGFERQKQLMDCDADSCMTEIAGSLGVDFIVVGGLGKVANSWVVDLRMLDVKKAAMASAYSERLRDGNEDSVLDAIPKAAAQFAAATGRAPALQTRQAEQHVVTAQTPADAAPGKGPNMPMLAAGGAGLGAAVLGVVGALALVLGAVAVKGLLNQVYLPELKEGAYGFIALYLGMGVLGAVVGALAVALGIGGAALLAAGVVL